MSRRYLILMYPVLFVGSWFLYDLIVPTHGRLPYYVLCLVLGAGGGMLAALLDERRDRRLTAERSRRQESPEPWEGC